MNHVMVLTLLVLQGFVVAFILLHDWVPLGRFNNLQGVREVDPLGKRIAVTLLSALPFALTLWFSWEYAAAPRFPMWVRMWLWATYGLSVLAAARAWWIPYLGPGDPEVTARYQVRFADTHAFLPERNGMAPDTLHVALHTVLLAILVMVAVL